MSRLGWAALLWLTALALLPEAFIRAVWSALTARKAKDVSDAP